MGTSGEPWRIDSLSECRDATDDRASLASLHDHSLICRVHSPNRVFSDYRSQAVSILAVPTNAIRFQQPESGLGND